MGQSKRNRRRNGTVWIGDKLITSEGCEDVIDSSPRHPSLLFPWLLGVDVSKEEE